MNRPFFAVSCSAAIVLSAATVTGVAAPTEFAADRAVGRAFLEQHCLACHQGTEAEGGLDLGGLSRELAEPETMHRWVRIHDRIAAGEMPPPGEPRPDRPAIDAVLAELDGWLLAADRDRQQREGRAVLRRLTAAEYENTLRDLLALPHLEVRQLLPADGSRHGFDKVGEALDLSHVQIQQYLTAADRALDLAIATRATPPPVVTKRFDVATMIKFRQNLRSGNAVLLDGRQADPAWYGDGRKDPGDKETAEPKIAAGRSIGFFGPNTAGAEKFVSFIPLHPGMYRLRMSIWSFLWKAGQVAASPRTEVALLQDGGRVLGYFDAPSLEPTVHEVRAWLGDARAPAFDVASLTFRGGASRDDRPGIAVDWIEVEGPLVETWPPESHRRLFGDLPIKPLSVAVGQEASLPARPRFREAPWAWPRVADLPTAERSPRVESVASARPDRDARKLLAEFLPRAFRRPVTDAEIDRFAAISVGRVKQGDCFEEAMRQAYKAVLTSPDFLFRRESTGRLDGHALATRLAYWLWNGPPDEPLLAAADRLHDPQVMREQVEWLLDDPRSDRFVSDFLDQWLNLARIDDTDPDRKLYPEFQVLYLKESMLGESRAFLRELLREDLPVTNLVKSDFAMLNERLVQHYGLTGREAGGVAGSEIRRVPLTAKSHRGGFLTQAAVLKVTANGTTTSPVIRGGFVMERLLGETIPPPPPNVPAIEPDTQGATTIRALLERHRADAACAGCHRKMDPAGFALESFDPIGGWRERYRSQGKGDPAPAPLFDGQKPTFRLGPPVDASGTLADGSRFADFEAFRRLLLADPERLARAFTAQLVTYATGAEPSYADRPEIDAIVKGTVSEGHGIRSLVHAVARSRLFVEK
jgi:mono/diheme cytochrome c family protein